MKILKLMAENFKRLSAVEITPDGNVVVISGKNEAGKSSVLDSIEAALCGGRNLPKQPIKLGEHRAKVVVDMGEYKVTRKFLGTNSTLKVESVEGNVKANILRPQEFLDKVVGDISFDPLAFMKKSPAEQRNALMGFLGLNLDEFDNKVASLKAQRSEVRKEKERKLHEADSITFTPGLPEKEVDSGSLLRELNEITIHNQKCQEIATENAVAHQRLETTVSSIDAAEKNIENWQKRLADLRQLKVQLETQLSRNAGGIMKNPAEVEAKIKTLGDTNEAIRQNARKKQASIEYETAIETYSKLGEEIKQVEGQKARKMAEAVMPVKGLTIQSDGLAYNGIPLEQECDSKKLKICTAIAMAMNPKLKVLRINGNELDTDSLKSIGELVAGKDYQVWIEKVTDSNTIGFYIEDGHLMGDQNEKETN